MQTTRLLLESQSGSRAAMDELLPLVYDELRRLARAFLRRERPGHTLRPTALVHEAYLRLVSQREVTWQNRAQFFALAATMMRRVLINHAEARQAKKRWGSYERITLDPSHEIGETTDLDLVSLNQALEKLAGIDEDKVRVVEMRFFGGLTHDEIAEVTGSSRATVEREWSFARAWLRRELSG